MAPPPGLPPKKEVALALLRQSSVYIHLDPRPDAVRVPVMFKKQPQLILQVGLNMPVPIRDLDVGDEAISCTLSFNRTPHFCWIPWGAVFALIGENGPGMVWPDDVPKEVAAQQQKRESAPKLRAVPEPQAAPAAAKPQPVEETAQAPAPKKKRARKTDKRAAAAPAAAATPAAETAPARASRARKNADAPSPKRKVASSDAEAPSTPTPNPTPEGKPRRELPPYLRVIK